MNWIFFVAVFPLLWRFLAPLVPPQYIEPYAYWDPVKLNSEEGGRVPRWRNMGFWVTGDETFSQANAALANKLVQFADAKVDGRTLDMAHGAGESLLIHIQNGADIDALTSLPAETEQARELVEQWLKSADGEKYTPSMTFFTASAGYRANKDFDHPLNPMRGFMGENTETDKQAAFSADEDDEDEDNDDEAEQVEEAVAPTASAKYDLVYVLDAAYHFPPAIGHFAASVLPVLKQGGVLAYTDVLPPPSFSKFPLMLNAGWLAPFLHVPRRNLNERPATLQQYEEQLKKLGYSDAKVEDWTDNVFWPLANALENRSYGWLAYSKLLRFAEKTGWRFVAVRAQK